MSCPLLALSASEVADLVQAAAVVFGVYVAWRGLHTWSEQLRGTSTFEAADATMQACLALAEVLRKLRESWTFGGPRDQRRSWEHFMEETLKAKQSIHEASTEYVVARRRLAARLGRRFESLGSGLLDAGEMLAYALQRELFAQAGNQPESRAEHIAEVLRTENEPEPVAYLARVRDHKIAVEKELASYLRR